MKTFTSVLKALGVAFAIIGVAPLLFVGLLIALEPHPSGWKPPANMSGPPAVADNLLHTRAGISVVAAGVFVYLEAANIVHTVQDKLDSAFLPKPVPFTGAADPHGFVISTYALTGNNGAPSIGEGQCIVTTPNGTHSLDITATFGNEHSYSVSGEHISCSLNQVANRGHATVGIRIQDPKDLHWLQVATSTTTALVTATAEGLNA